MSTGSAVTAGSLPQTKTWDSVGSDRIWRVTMWVSKATFVIDVSTCRCCDVDEMRKDSCGPRVL